MRTAAAAAGLVGVLALTACSGSGSKDDTSSSTPSATPTSTGGATGAVTGASDKLQGSWITTSKGTIVALVITGKKAGLFATGGSVCSGAAGAESGMQMIHLTCTDGNKDRGTGMVDSVNKDGMKVTWSGKLGQETYTKAEGGKLPPGLPTAAAKS
ncbi:hypothetical protein AVL59_02635 [Streptomyces griseochromogenes]|uniref:Lipoprotein n=1 Tax=Streptomyces griseochromogenes TaxID=68214 RepID=A0A1B1APW0_9ACTN|nr:hypothetical protein AVL59_02635 [Streptomyces griseochromogenes]